MNSKEYWTEREREALEGYMADEAQYAKEINSIYTNMLDNIQKEIDSFYSKYADEEGITLAEAKKRVSSLDIDEYSAKAKEYVRTRDLSDLANQEMKIYNLTMKVNRLEMLKARIGLAMISGYDDVEKYLNEVTNRRAMDEYERQAGILGASVKNAERRAQALAGASYKHANYSERLWTHQQVLKDKLSTLLQEGLVQGKSARALAPDIKDMFGVSRYAAERLMRTELSRVQTEAQMQSFKANGYEQYMYITLSSAPYTKSQVCPVCRPMNGQVYNVKDMRIGENAPPMHPNCRCSVAAYMDDDEFEKWLESRRNQESKLVLSSSKSTEKSLSDIYKGKAGLNNKRTSLLNRVPNTNDYVVLKNGSVEIKDLAYLSASEKHEFALWRSKNNDILCHGDSRHCYVPEELEKDFLSGKYELVAHSHVGTGVQPASGDDRNTLRKINQKKSKIIGIDGQITEYDVDFFNI